MEDAAKSAVPVTVDNAFVQKTFGEDCTVNAAVPAQVADLDGDGVDDIVIHVLALIARGGITSKLTGTVGTNYAHRNSLGISSSTFDTVGVTVGAQYLLGPVLASLTYNWLFVSNSTPQMPDYEFSKKMVMLSFSYAFATPAFFREGISLPSGAGTESSPSGDGTEILRKE